MLTGRVFLRGCASVTWCDSIGVCDCILPWWLPWCDSAAPFYLGGYSGVTLLLHSASVVLLLVSVTKYRRWEGPPKALVSGGLPPFELVLFTSALSSVGDLYLIRAAFSHIHGPTFQRDLGILRLSSQCPQSPAEQMLQNGPVSPLPEVRLSSHGVESPRSTPSLQFSANSLAVHSVEQLSLLSSRRMWSSELVTRMVTHPFRICSAVVQPLRLSLGTL